MREIPYIFYSVLLSLLLLSLLGRIAYAAYERRREGRLEVLVQELVKRLMELQWVADEEPLQLPLRPTAAHRLLLARILSRVVSATYGVDSGTLRRVVRAYDLDRYLLQRIHRARGYRRACYLRLLADLPIGQTVLDEVVHYRTDRLREIRFAALLVQLAARPDATLRLIADYREPMRAVEVAEILHLLRRGALPIAYRPLLASSDANLNRIGMALVVQFGIEESESELMRLVPMEGALGIRAIYVLATLHRPLRRREVVERVRGMSPSERRILLRYMVGQEYATDQLRRLFGVVEQPYSERLVASYKRSLVCG